MKKFNLTLAVAILTSLFIACSEPTKEDLIEKAFKEYVNKNFDDPNDLKEIVSIEVQDTIKNTISEFICNVHILDSASSECDSLYLKNVDIDNFTKQLGKFESKAKNLSNYEKNKLMNMFYEYFNSLIKYQSYDRKKIKQMVNELDSISKVLILNMPDMELYNINARIKNDKVLRLEKFYALADSINVRIYKEEPAVEEYSTEIGALKKRMDDFFEEQKVFMKIMDDVKRNIEELKERFRKSGIFIY